VENNAEEDAKLRGKNMALLYPKESYIIRGIAFDIYKQFRNNHKEKVYHNAFYLGLVYKGLKVEKEKQISVYYNGKKVGVYTPDLVVNDVILIEIKAKPKLTKQDIEQFWHYLKGSNYKLGFLINFGAQKGVQIIRRIYDTARCKTK
jgi:GxxExxY protein